MATTTEPTFRRTTWLGVPGRMATIDERREVRATIHIWEDDSVGQPTVHPAGTAIVGIVSGDFRYGTGVTHHERVFPPGSWSTEAFLAAYARQMLDEIRAGQR